MENINQRVCIVDKSKCFPKKCGLECKKICPINMAGQKCVEVSKTVEFSEIHEQLCTGCNQCAKKCPFRAIVIINLPCNFRQSIIHRYGPNQFQLNFIPTPRIGKVLGIVGCNGIGKSTALKILAGKMKPNLGRADNPPEWDEILNYFKQGEVKQYFQNLLKDHFKCIIKPQYVDCIKYQVKGLVGEIIQLKDQNGISQQLIYDLNLEDKLDRQVNTLSGGELQRFAILITCITDAQIIMFDEPSSYLDIMQRIKVSKIIREQVELQGQKKYVIVVEHDLSILDFLSDYVCCMYGRQSAYGIVSQPYSVRTGINIYLDGYIPEEKIRFRDFQLDFKTKSFQDQISPQNQLCFEYPKMRKAYQKEGKDNFILDIEDGKFKNQQIIVLLGENGTGKTSLIEIICGKDKQFSDKFTKQKISYKPQMLKSNFEGTVQDLLLEKVQEEWKYPKFKTEVTNPMMLDDILNQKVSELSGGQLQRVALIIVLCKQADIYLLDEPSTYLDSEQRIVSSNCIKRFILNNKKLAFVVEHDFIMATYLADQVIVFEGKPGVHSKANSPQDLLTGMNKFLTILSVTFRRDPTNFRPKINKLDSDKDRLQKKDGNLFCLDD